jgi:hypothetical protein
MKLEPISQTGTTTPQETVSSSTAISQESFAQLLESIKKPHLAGNQPLSAPSPLSASPEAIAVSLDGTKSRPGSMYAPRQAAAAYRQQSAPTTPAQKPSPVPSSQSISSYQKYKEDQLLRNPGGDFYDLEHKRVDTDPARRKSWWGRVGQDLSASFGNIKNMFSNFLFGAKFCYRNQNQEIREATRKGMTGAVVDFFRDLGSAFSFGHWRPDGSPKPEGLLERLGFFVSHLKKAISRDLFDGVGGSVNHMAGNLVLAGWNLVQVLPDATLGNLDAGRKLTTTLFDNGQVMVEYLTDVAPGGDAWLRVHAPSLKEGKLPLIYNLGMPEHFSGDSRWEYIRNTPFRKSIETIGTLLADIAVAFASGQSSLFSDDAPKRTLP